jgi:hypothetical protein
MVYNQTNVRTYYNESQQGSDNYTSNITNTTNYLYLGISPNGTSGNGTGVQNPIDADIYEAMIFGVGLSSVKRILIHNYLAAKYNITLGSNDLYDEDNTANGDYDFDVVGIGKESDGSHEDVQGSGIVRVHSPSGLGNGEYLFFGHNNGALNSFGITDLPAGIEARLGRDWSASETGEVGTVSISFDLSGVAGSKTASDLRLLIDADGVFSSGATALSGASHLGGGVYQWTGVDIDDNNHFTIGTINESQTPLPADLIDFKVALSQDNESVDIFWSTASELNIDYFRIERSANKADFELVEKVGAIGNSATVESYYLSDAHPLKPVTYYRLSSVDRDGSIKYFPIQIVQLPDELLQNQSLHIYPNPSDGSLIHINLPSDFQGEFQVLVTDLSGKNLPLHFDTSAQNNLKVLKVCPLNQLVAGQYIISVQTQLKTYSALLSVE